MIESHEVHNVFYKKGLERMWSFISTPFVEFDKDRKRTTAIVGLVIRDVNNIEGTIDIMTNLTTESLIHILNEAIRSAEKNG